MKLKCCHLRNRHCSVNNFLNKFVSILFSLRKNFVTWVLLANKIS